MEFYGFSERCCITVLNYNKKNNVGIILLTAHSF